MQNDHPNATAFLKSIHRHIVCIAARYEDDPQPAKPIGTGFIFGYRKRPSGRLMPIIVTAGHVLDHDRRDRTEWFVARLGSDTHPQRVASFITPAEGDGAANAVWYAGKWYGGRHSAKPLQYDIGTLSFDNDACPGGFIAPDEKPPVVIHQSLAVTIGTRVAWAGFPLHAAVVSGADRLCYFEGVISTTIEGPDLPSVYLIDGHNMKGLSGAPVWWWNEAANQAEVVAVVTHYSRIESELPGFVHASYVNPLVERIKQDAAEIIGL